eukprot:467443-Alexandrium_andersonii.AAC.1
MLRRTPLSAWRSGPPGPGGALGEAPVDEVDLGHVPRLLLDGADETRGEVAGYADELALARLGFALGSVLPEARAGARAIGEPG